MRGAPKVPVFLLNNKIFGWLEMISTIHELTQMPPEDTCAIRVCGSWDEAGRRQDQWRLYTPESGESRHDGSLEFKSIVYEPIEPGISSKQLASLWIGKCRVFFHKAIWVNRVCQTFGLSVEHKQLLDG